MTQLNCNKISDSTKKQEKKVSTLFHSVVLTAAELQTAARPFGFGSGFFSFFFFKQKCKVHVNTPEDHNELQSKETRGISLEISRRHTPASIIHVIVFGPVLTSYQIATTEALCRHLHGEKNRRKHPCPLLAAVPKQQQSIVLKTAWVCLCVCVNPAAGHLLVLHHVHYDPV